MKKKAKHSSIFLRLFLSHLLLLMFTCIAGMFVFDFVFASGITLFIERTPVILIPVLLALIGLAGLLALWSAAGIVIPLEQLTRRLEEANAPDATFDSSTYPEEIADLDRLLAEYIVDSRRRGNARFVDGDEASESGPTGVESIHTSTDVDEGEAPAALLLSVDREWNITEASAGLAALLAADTSQLRGRHVLDVLDTEREPLFAHAELLSLSRSGMQLEDFVTRKRGDEGRMLTVSWKSEDLRDEYGSVAGRNLTGTIVQDGVS